MQLLLQRSQAILLTSIFESLTVALLEAMAAGVVPVVRAIESGIPELVHHERTGVLAENDPGDAAAALVRLSREPDLWHHCSTQARSLVDDSYTAGHCFELWLGLIQQRQGTIVQFPLITSNLRQLLPLGDAPSQMQYRTTPTPSNNLHPRRLVGAAKRRFGL